VINPVKNEGEVSTLLRQLALTQLDALAARFVYNSRGYQSPGLRLSDVNYDSLNEIADALFLRVSSSKISMNISDEVDWKQAFLREADQHRRELVLIWESKWKEECDGKLLFADLQKEGILKISSSSLKRRIVQEMRNAKSENWRIVNSLLQQLLTPIT
jgi:hypothetical protein